jgi:hypothetical protein
MLKFKTRRSKYCWKLFLGNLFRNNKLKKKNIVLNYIKRKLLIFIKKKFALKLFNYFLEFKNKLFNS